MLLFIHIQHICVFFIFKSYKIVQFLSFIINPQDIMLTLLYNSFVIIFSQRTGQIRVLSFKVGLVLLCKGHLEEKYRCK